MATLGLKFCVKNSLWTLIVRHKLARKLALVILSRV